MYVINKVHCRSLTWPTFIIIESVVENRKMIIINTEQSMYKSPEGQERKKMWWPVLIF